MRPAIVPLMVCAFTFQLSSSLAKRSREFSTPWSETFSFPATYKTAKVPMPLVIAFNTNLRDLFFLARSSKNNSNNFIGTHTCLIYREGLK